MGETLGKVYEWTLGSLEKMIGGLASVAGAPGSSTEEEKRWKWREEEPAAVLCW